MRPSLFPSDDALPTWLHTTLLLLIVSPFSLYLLWLGIQAIAAGHLEPLNGPEFGQTFFGHLALEGKAARVAGFSLVVLGCAFIALAVGTMRIAKANAVLRALPWALVAAFAVLSFWVKSLA